MTVPILAASCAARVGTTGLNSASDPATWKRTANHHVRLLQRLKLRCAVNTGSGVLILDVVRPPSRKILWYASKNLGLSWSTKTAVEALFKNLREYAEGQQSAPANAIKPVAAKLEQE